MTVRLLTNIGRLWTGSEILSNAAIVTYDGGQDDSLVSYLNVSFVDNGTSFWTNGNALVTTGSAYTKPNVGQTFTTDGDGACGSSGCIFSKIPTHVVVTGSFNDGTKQVILDTYI